MEEYRKLVRTRVRLMRIFALLMFIVVLWDVFWDLPVVPAVGIPFNTDFLTGALLGLELVVFFKGRRYVKALRDEAVLKEVYVKDNDERELLLWQLAGQQAFFITMPCLVGAGLIAAYWSLAVGITLWCAAIFVGLVTKGLRLYYAQKY